MGPFKYDNLHLSFVFECFLKKVFLLLKDEGAFSCFFYAFVVE